MCVVLSASLGACAKKTPPVARPLPPEPPAPTAVTPTPPPAPPAAPAEQPAPATAAKVPEDPFLARSLDELNRDSPLKPVFFDYDASELNTEAVATLRANADLLRKYPTWAVTIEGHCDERGTAEYNLALGERRAASARTYLVSLGIAADRLRIVSYGKEFPFDPAHTEEAWARNRRGHFVVTGK
ncbi:MAG: peptidoglycan-associated lipoprotein Pal [Acidobacteria bacterium]|nr:peptidoglycan-associated lipoprotein Pal [Acidobacteriota bacterium]